MENERGFSLLEFVVVLAIVSGVVLVATALRGTQPPIVHTAALGLQAALVEARTLATSNAAFGGSGATLTAVYDPSAGTTLTVYAYRPIATLLAPARVAGFPPQRFPVAMSIPGLTTAGQPFSIFISSSGYASVAPRYVFDGSNALTADPGCDETAGVTIAISAGAQVETHPLDCREAQYQAG